jgi:hypothetical protein
MDLHEAPARLHALRAEHARRGADKRTFANIVAARCAYVRLLP